MQVNGPSHIDGAQPIRAPHSIRPAENAPASSAVAGPDELSISPEADLLSRISELPDIRQDQVDEIRTRIAEGSYETQEKLEVAVARLLDEIA